MTSLQLPIEDCWSLKPYDDGYAVVGIWRNVRVIGVFKVARAVLARVLFPLLVLACVALAPPAVGAGDTLDVYAPCEDETGRRFSSPYAFVDGLRPQGLCLPPGTWEQLREHERQRDVHRPRPTPWPGSGW